MEVNEEWGLGNQLWYDIFALGEEREGKCSTPAFSCTNSSRTYILSHPFACHAFSHLTTMVTRMLTAPHIQFQVLAILVFTHYYSKTDSSTCIFVKSCLQRILTLPAHLPFLQIRTCFHAFHSLFLEVHMFPSLLFFIIADREAPDAGWRAGEVIVGTGK